METRLYFQMLKRGWWVILLTTLTALAAALIASYFAVPRYTSVARFIISPSSVLINRSDVLSSLNTLDNQSVMTTYAEVMNSDRIYNDSLAALKLTAVDLKQYTTKAAVVTSSSVLELTVTGPDPQMTAKLANTMGDETINFTRRLNQVYSVDFLDIATPPLLPSSPRPLLDAGLATFLGLVVGAVLAIAIEQLRLPLDSFRRSLQLDNDSGVFNHKYFQRLVDDELTRHPDESLTVGILELDGIRDLVDSFPLVGLQRILQSVTDSLHKELRGNDIIGRWNDISFAVMLPNTPGTPAEGIFERILVALSQPVKLDQLNMNVNLDAYMGGAENRERNSTRELFELADRALEQARKSGNSRVNVWEADKRMVKK